jgi:hypothetical protein
MMLLSTNLVKLKNIRPSSNTVYNCTFLRTNVDSVAEVGFAKV